MILLLPLLFGALLNQCEGLQANLQYKYDYTGTISTWTPNDPTQSSGTAMRAMVALQLSGTGDILVKIDNVRVGEHNGKNTCNQHQDAEFSYREMDPQDAALLQTPFLVHVNTSQVSYMEVPPEPVWVNNIRRGIINTLPLVVLTGQHPSRLTFGLKEDTMIGSCFNWYSMLKLAGHRMKVEDKKQEEVIEVDVQREQRTASYAAPKGKGKKSKTRKTSPGKGRPSPARYTVAPIHDTLSILTRTLDDQQCKDNHFTMKHNANQESVERTQRSSEGKFLIRGEGAIVRLERAEIVGDIVIYTGESDDEFIRTSSKQVLQLRSVQQLGEIFSIPYEPEKRALSFSVAKGQQSNIKEKLLGTHPGPQQIESNMAGILEDLSVLREIRYVQGAEAPGFLEVFQRLVERMTILSWTEVEDLASRVATSEREKFIIYQAMFASGRDEGLAPILQKMKVQSFRYAPLVFQLLQSPLTPVRNPALIPAMLEVVTNMSRYESTAKILSLLNIAKLANRLCLNSQTGNLCDPGCDTDLLLHSFLPMLSQYLNDPEPWKRIVGVQAMCALGSPYSIPYLEPIIQGTNNEDHHIRINAIACLTNDHLPKTALDMVFDSLMPVMNNPTEFPEVRNIAFLVLTSWKPTLSWWEKVAISTWSEKSSQVVSFVSSALTSLSQGGDYRSKNAKKVVHLAKHPHVSEGHSFTKSTYIYMDEISKNCQVRSSVKLAWLSTTKSFIPRSVYWQLQLTTAMGTTQRETGYLFTKVMREINKNVHPAIRQEQNNYEDQTMFSDIFMELTEELELNINNPDEEEPFLLALLLEPLSLLAGIRADGLSYMLSHMMADQIPVHLRMADLMLAFPTDLGLPMVVKHEDDVAFALALNMTREFSVEVSGHHRNALKVNTLVPWSDGVAAGVGVETNYDINLHLTMKTERRTGIEVLTLGLSPKQKVRMMSLSSVMYTSLTPLYHVVDTVLTSEESDSRMLGRKVIWNRSPKEGTDILLPNSGLDLQIKWTCDLEQPSDFFNVFIRVLHTQLVYQNFDYKILVDVEHSSTKNIAFMYSFDTKERRQEQVVQEADYGQHSQDLDDMELFSQVPNYGSSGFDDDFGQSSNAFGQNPDEAIFDRQQQHSPTFTNHMSRKQELIMPPTGGSAYTMILTMEPQNFPRKYEIAATVTSTKGNITKMHVAVMTSPMAGVIGDTHMTCVDLRMEVPLVLPLMPIEALLQMDLASNLLINIYDGGNCEGARGMKLLGTLNVSSAALQNMQSAEEMGSCDKDIQEKPRLLYDQATLTGKWTQDFRNSYKFVESVVVNQMESFSMVNVKSEDGRPGNEFTATADLNTEKHEWNVTVSGPQVTSVIAVPDLQISRKSPMNGYDTFDDFEKVCHVTRESVKTYDGLTYAFQPPSCWATASIFSDSRSRRLRTDSFSYLQVAVQVRFTDQWEVHLTVPFYAVVIDVTRSDIWVNDEPLVGDSEKFVIHRLQDSIIIGIGMVVVRVGDTVDIMVSSLYYGAVKGICGNYDGEPINDMMGPTGCLYTDPSLHTLAWTTKAQTDCNRFTLRNQKRPLAEYREGCDKEVFLPTDISQENPMMNCTKWEYGERQLPSGVSCRSKVPYPVCLPNCHGGSTTTSQLGYNCKFESTQCTISGVHYSENFQCFSKVFPITYPTACT